MASHLIIEAADVNKGGLRDGAAHRQGVAPVYNAYRRVSGDPAFTGKQGDYRALLGPLFMLSFLVDDFLAENELFGAKSVLLSSASSKTSFGLAHLLHARKNIRVIGLTSPSNVAFVQSLGCYDEVVTYDKVAALPANAPVAYVDMAGNSGLRETLHRHFGDQMKYSGRVGLTHRRTDPNERGTAWRQAAVVLRARPDPQAGQGMGPWWRRPALWRGVGGLRAETRHMAEGDRKPRTGAREAGLSRYPEWPCSPREGHILVARRNSRLRVLHLPAASRMGIGLLQTGRTRRPLERSAHAGQDVRHCDCRRKLAGGV